MKRISSQILILGAMLLSLVACLKPEITDQFLNHAFSLELGQTARIPSEKMEIKFAEVKSDSRCPTSVECIWAGEVTVSLTLKIDQDVNTEFELSLWGGEEDKAKKVISGYTFELLEVNPYPVNEGPIGSDYEILLIVKK